MSKRLKAIFYMLLTLYIILLFTNWHAIYYFSQRIGFIATIKEGNIVYDISIIIIAIFVFKKQKYILPISFILMLFWLCSMPIFSVNIEGVKAVKYVYNMALQGNVQGFSLFFSSWAIPVVSFAGCIVWYLDVKKSKSLDKHWSE